MISFDLVDVGGANLQASVASGKAFHYGGMNLYDDECPMVMT